MKSTKEIREAVAIYTELPRTNRFKRAVDLALAQDLPLSIRVAAPFRGFTAKFSDGKTATFKIKLKNTNTGAVSFIGRCSTKTHGDYKNAFYKGCNYGIAGAAEFDQINEMILRNDGAADLSKVQYTHVGAHSSDDVKESITWSGFALAISKVCKKDFAHTSPCSKCSGTGFIAAFAHVSNGICFDCCGSGQNLHIGEESNKIKI